MNLGCFCYRSTDELLAELSNVSHTLQGAAAHCACADYTCLTPAGGTR